MRYRALEITVEVPCGVRCKYCPQDTLAERYKGNRRLKLEDFKRYLAKVPNDVKIHFSGFCEPFQSREAADMMVHADREGYEIVLFTTLVSAKARDLKMIRDIKFRQLVIHEVEGTRNELRPLLRGTGYRVVKVVNGNTRSGNLAPVEKRGPGPVNCPRWDQPVLLPNGEVVLCCQDYGLKHVIGDLNESTYEEILAGEKYQKILDEQDDENSEVLCRFCDLSPGCLDIRRGRVIFLVGMGRSGTTWIGQLLAANLGYRYVHEPFNWLSFGLGKYRFKYLDPDVVDEKFDQKWEEVERSGSKILIKDIHTPFTLPYVEKNFRPERIFVLRRNPFAMLDSWLRMGWTVHQQFNMIREQKVLRDLLPEVVVNAEINRSPYAFRFGVLWSCYYYLIEKLGIGEIIDYDQLAAHNVREIARFLGYEATEQGTKFFREHADTVGKQKHPYTTYRDAAVCLTGWKRNVTIYQTEQVAEALKLFGYDVGDWWS